MDFTTRGHQSTQPNTNRFAPAGDNRPAPDDKPKKKDGNGRNSVWVRSGLILFLLCLVALVVALLLFIGLGNRLDETDYVNASLHQAVEVANPGSNAPTYYYGEITSINDNYIVLTQAFMLTSSFDKPVSIAPLACVAPNSTNQLVLNRSQVILWENLSADSAVAQAIDQQAKQAGSCPGQSQPKTESQAAPAKNPEGTSAGSQLPKTEDNQASQPSADTSTTTSNSTTTSPTSGTSPSTP